MTYEIIWEVFYIDLFKMCVVGAILSVRAHDTCFARFLKQQTRNAGLWFCKHWSGLRVVTWSHMVLYIIWFYLAYSFKFFHCGCYKSVETLNTGLLRLLLPCITQECLKVFRLLHAVETRITEHWKSVLKKGSYSQAYNIGIKISHTRLKE